MKKKPDTNSNSRAPFIACMGPAGTFSYQAACCYVSKTKTNLSVLPVGDIQATLSAVETGWDQESPVSEAIVPIENMIEGTVHETLDFLIHSQKTIIIYELVMSVEQNIIGWQGTRLENVKTILSHYQPIAQCRQNLKRLMPQANQVVTHSTVKAIETVAESRNPEMVAIGNALVNEKYGLVTLYQDVSDVKNNQTRFLVLKHETVIPIDRKSDKISIVFSLPKDQPGGLYKVLEFLKNVNLTKIESRPSKEVMGKYYFFIDIEADYSDPDTRQTLKNIEGITDTYKILGAYKEVKTC